MCGGDVGVIANVKAERFGGPVGGVGDANAGRYDDLIFGKSARAGAFDVERVGLGQVGAIKSAVDLQGLAKTCGAGTKLGLFLCAVFAGVAMLEHQVDALGGLQRAYQDSDGVIGLADDGIDTMVHAIGEVDVGMATVAPHGLVAWGASAVVGVCGAVG